MLNRTESEHQPLGRQKSRRLCERPCFYRRRRAGREISTGQSRICPLHPVADSCLLRIVKFRYSQGLPTLVRKTQGEGHVTDAAVAPSAG